MSHCVQLTRRVGVHVVQDGHEDAGVRQQRRRMPYRQAVQRGQRGADLRRSWRAQVRMQRAQHLLRAHAFYGSDPIDLACYLSIVLCL